MERGDMQEEGKVGKKKVKKKVEKGRTG